jgi:hypothetical protein
MITRLEIAWYLNHNHMFNICIFEYFQSLGKIHQNSFIFSFKMQFYLLVHCHLRQLQKSSLLCLNLGLVNQWKHTF